MKKTIIFGALATLVLILGLEDTTQAYINPNIQLANKAVGIAVSPMTNDRINMVPGGQYDGRFRVRQTGHETSDIMIMVAPLNPARDYETETDRTQIKHWTTFSIEGCDVDRVEDGDTYVTMRSQEECFVNYHISVPHDAMGGSQNASIVVRSAVRSDVGQTSGQSGLNYQYQIAYALFSDVDGPGAHYAGKILENNIPWILFNPPLEVNSLIENTGNLDFKTTHKVVMNDYFGGKEVFNKSWTGLVMADSKGTEKAIWEEAPAFGLFQVTQEIKALDEESNKTQLVLLIPIWLILIILGVIILLVWAVVLRAKQQKDNQ